MHRTSLRFTIVAAVLAYSTGGAFAQYLPPDTKTSNGKKVAPRGAVMKGVDASGKIVYTDHPVQGVKEVKTLSGRSFGPIPSSAAAVPASAAASGSLVDWAQKVQAQMDDQKKQTQQVNDQVDKRNCQNAKESLASLSAGGRVVRLGPNGTPEVLSAEQVESDKAKANEVIAKSCK